MHILVINSGSSSIKFQLFQMLNQTAICSGLIERIGLENAQIHYKTQHINKSITLDIADHKKGLQEVIKLILDREVGVVKNASEINAVGHRVVHGGSTFSNTTLIDEAVKQKIKELFAIAPLHNPPNFIGIEVAEQLFPDAKQVAIFDTAFHQSIPEKTYTYALPKELMAKNKIRMYGFHGTSHKYVSEKAIEDLGVRNSKIITIHLGNGCSITALKDGKSVDHSLGFGPVNGLVMGTRSGDIDQSIIFYLVNSLGYTLDQVNNLLQKESGMLGLTGYSDLREIEAAAANGNIDCKLALEINTYRIKKYIGSYTAAMNGLDALVFTAGIGENSSTIRQMVCSNLEFLGVALDEEKNEVRANNLREIQKVSSSVKILIIPTNEEIEIAKQTYQLITKD